MPTNQTPLITFDALATAYLSRLLSEEAFLILWSLTESIDGLPHSLNSRMSRSRPQSEG